MKSMKLPNPFCAGLALVSLVSLALPVLLSGCTAERGVRTPDVSEAVRVELAQTAPPNPHPALFLPR